MAVVKGSKQDHLVVVSYDPWRRFLRKFFWLVFFISLAAASYYVGRFEARQSGVTAVMERDQLKDALADSQTEANGLKQRIAMLEKGGEVDRQATEGMRSNLVEMREQIAKLQEEVAFYKGLMAPASQEKGLRIQKVDMQTTAEPRRYRYKLMLTQVSSNDTYIDGLAAMNVIGFEKGAQKIYALRDLADDIDDYGIKFKFRYFQEITGDLVLPAGFKADSIEVVLQSKGAKATRVEERFPWPVKETR